MQVTVFGGSRRIGRHVVAELTAGGHTVLNADRRRTSPGSTTSPAPNCMWNTDLTRLGGGGLDRIWQLRDNLSAYDAVYVALTEALGAVLITGDRRLVRTPGLRIRVNPI